MYDGYELWLIDFECFQEYFLEYNYSENIIKEIRKLNDYGDGKVECEEKVELLLKFSRSTFSQCFNLSWKYEYNNKVIGKTINNINF